MQFICKIDREIYSCVTKDITTDEVVITDERIEHIKDRHPGDYERYRSYLKLAVAEPDYILWADMPDTAFVLKSFPQDEQQFRVIIRIHTSVDEPTRKNSIITFQHIKVREYLRLLKNKKVLYKKSDS